MEISSISPALEGDRATGNLVQSEFEGVGLGSGFSQGEEEDEKHT